MLDLTWIFLSVLFLYFALVYWQYSTMPVRPFIIRQKEYTAKEAKGEADPLIDEIAHDIEGYLTSISKTSKTRYRVAAAGFLIAGINTLAAIIIF